MAVLKGIFLAVGIILLCFNLILIRTYFEHKSEILLMIRNKINKDANENPSNNGIKKLDEMQDDELQKLINCAAAGLFLGLALFSIGFIIGAILVG